MRQSFDVDGIRAIVQHKGFEDVEKLMLEYKAEMQERSSQLKATVEQTGMNTIVFSSKASAVDELFERIQEATKASFDSKKRKRKDQDDA